MDQLKLVNWVNDVLSKPRNKLKQKWMLMNEKQFSSDEKKTTTISKIIYILNFQWNAYHISALINRIDQFENRFTWLLKTKHVPSHWTMPSSFWSLMCTGHSRSCYMPWRKKNLLNLQINSIEWFNRVDSCRLKWFKNWIVHTAFK